jgi:hypothetical protein
MHADQSETGSGQIPRSQRYWHQRLLAGCAVATLILGTIGFLHYHPDGQGDVSFTNALYHTFQLFALHTPHFEKRVPLTLEIGRWLGAVSTIMAVLGVARRMFREEQTAFQLRQLNGHTIVCGLGRRGLAVVRRLRNQKRKVVVVEKVPQPEAAEACRKLGAYLVIGDASHSEALQQAGIERAQMLIALCPEDSTNCEIAANARSVCSTPKEAEAALQCRVQVGDPEARRTLQVWLAEDQSKHQAVVHFFDTYDPEARYLLVHGLPMDHDGIKPGEKRQVHLIILGFGKMGRTLAVRAAQLSVFAQPGRLKISVIDRDSAVRENELLFRHPYIKEVCDFDFKPFEGISADTRKFLKELCGRRDSFTSVAICFDNEQRALEIALQLRQLVESNDVRVAVRLSGQSGLANLMRAEGAEPHSSTNLRPFGREERATESGALADDSAEQFARQIHVSYIEMRKREATGDRIMLERLAHDPALRDWDELSEDLRESNRQQADHIHIKLRALGMEVAEASDPRLPVKEFTAEQTEMLAEMEHRRWVAERRVANWTYAPVKNERRRENPNLVAWEKLSEVTKDYDRTAVRQMPALLTGAGKRICLKQKPAQAPQ